MILEMTALELTRAIANLFSITMSMDIGYQEQKIEEYLKLEKQKQLGKANFNHELNILKIVHGEIINRKINEEQRKTQEYEEFLKSIDEIKVDMLRTFTDMPKPMIYIIYHHTKLLLDEMWKYESASNDKYIMAAKQYSDFLMALSQDKLDVDNGLQPKKPNATLLLLERR